MSFLVLLITSCVGKGSPKEEAMSTETLPTSPLAEEEAGLIPLTPGDPFKKRILQATKPVIVQCYTPYCGKCRALKPVLERLSTEYAGKADFVKVNTYGADSFIREHRVLGLPLVLLFKEGREAGRLMGTINEKEIRALLDKLLEQ